MNNTDGKCPGPLLPSYGKNLDNCLDDCCLPCPFPNNFYQEGALDRAYKIFSSLGIISFFLMLFLAVTFIVLPSAKRNPTTKQLLLPFVLSVCIFTFEGFFTVQQRKSQISIRANWRSESHVKDSNIRSSMTETQRKFSEIKMIFMMQWRALLGGLLMLVLYLFDSIYFVHLYPTRIDTSEDWFLSWRDCIYNNSQDECASKASGHLPSYSVAIFMLFLNRCAGILIFIIFAAKKGFLTEIYQVITGQPPSSNLVGSRSVGRHSTTLVINDSNSRPRSIALSEKRISSFHWGTSEPAPIPLSLSTRKITDNIALQQIQTKLPAPLPFDEISNNLGPPPRSPLNSKTYSLNDSTRSNSPTPTHGSCARASSTIIPISPKSPNRMSFPIENPPEISHSSRSSVSSGHNSSNDQSTPEWLTPFKSHNLHAPSMARASFGLVDSPPDSAGDIRHISITGPVSQKTIESHENLHVPDKDTNTRSSEIIDVHLEIQSDASTSFKSNDERDLKENEEEIKKDDGERTLTFGHEEEEIWDPLNLNVVSSENTNEAGFLTEIYQVITGQPPSSNLVGSRSVGRHSTTLVINDSNSRPRSIALSEKRISSFHWGTSEPAPIPLSLSTRKITDNIALQQIQTKLPAPLPFDEISNNLGPPPRSPLNSKTYSLNDSTRSNSPTPTHGSCARASSTIIPISPKSPNRMSFPIENPPEISHSSRSSVSSGHNSSNDQSTPEWLTPFKSHNLHAPSMARASFGLVDSPPDSAGDIRHISITGPVSQKTIESHENLHVPDKDTNTRSSEIIDVHLEIQSDASTSFKSNDERDLKENEEEIKKDDGERTLTFGHEEEEIWDPLNLNVVSSENTNEAGEKVVAIQIPDNNNQ
ncbi:10447_t:CDS:2 [Ambispora gerdemannii]|uniref:10447_t:CDS:1 n=1 Tax=Ambispora gerdemannii TaxID=144530 RepID=A0A9N9F2P8_9GLOM|nr:10447_t:CDS:2 [Ambispora gerdemannii]